MTKRLFFLLMLSLGAVGLLGVVKFFQVQAMVAQAASFQPPPEAVTTIKASHQQWSTTLEAIGTVVAVHGVTVSADLPGVVEAIAFDSGRAVSAGEVLVRLDSRQEQAQLAAAEAQRDLARLNLDRTRGLVEQGIVAVADSDRVVAEYKQAVARVGETRATIERKQIRAPFAGVLGIRQVNLGQYLNAGNPVVPLQSLDPIYVNFSVPQQQAGEMRVGGEVEVTADGQAEDFRGQVSAMDSVVDTATRNVQVQATFRNQGGRLRPGMFVQAHVHVGRSARVLTLPASAISYAPYGDSVFVVAELKPSGGGAGYRGVRQQFVKLGPARGDQVAVVSGLRPGDEVVTSGAFKLRNGAAVLVNNLVQPGNDPRPVPEDN